MKWPWRKDKNGDRKSAALKAEAEFEATKRMTPVVKKLAPNVADLPPDEFADRVSRAFRRRPA